MRDKEEFIMAKATMKKKTNIFQQTEFTLGLIIVILFVGASVFTDNFCTLYNVTNLTETMCDYRSYGSSTDDDYYHWGN